MSVAKTKAKVTSIKKDKAKEGEAKQVASMMPEPVGYQLQILLPKDETVTDGGVIKPDLLVDRERTATIVGFVHSMGVDAYKDTTRFPSQIPWCKVGDWVIFSAFVGTRVKVGKQEIRFINDDCVQAVVEDPRGIKRL